MMTRLPTPAISRFTSDMPTRAARYYPVAGWLVGAIAAGVFWGASRVGNPLVAAVLAITAGAIVTGGFHEDGLADTADGLGGGQTPERRLDIMKDSRLGTYGTLALVLVTALRIASLSALPPLLGALSLVSSHSMARATPILLMRYGRYVGDPATAKLPHTDMRVTTVELALAWALALVPALMFPLSSVGMVLAGSVAVVLVIGRKSFSLVGGYTGDVLGCIEQVTEAIILTTFAWALVAR
jgi:adenosylcobinamide-GDP ribazoletransferase